MNKFKLIFFGFIGIFTLIVGGYMFLGQLTKNSGKVIEPTELVNTQTKFDTYFQKDIKHKGYPAFIYGKPTNSGAIPCVLTSALTGFGLKINPQEVYEQLNANEAFSNEKTFNWKKIEKAYPGYSYFHKKLFSGGDVCAEIKKGRLPILEVEIPQTTMRHWVIAYASEGDDFIIYDPLEGIGSSYYNSKRLKKYGKVFAFRVVYKTDYIKLGK